MATIDELERRVRFVESEVEGEKAVTRSVYDQSVRNGAQVGALRSEVALARVDIQELAQRMEQVVQETVQNTAALRNHATLLTMLQQDVSALRNDATELRRGQEASNARLDHVDARLDQMDARLDQVNARLDQMDRKLDMLIAAVMPRDPA